MRILDDERWRAFIKAFLIFLIALVSLYIVADALANLDEFLKIEDGELGLFLRMGRYYLGQMGLFVSRLSGVALVLSALVVFVVRPILKCRLA
jgi:lipopolysaccharide export system permease protein